MSVGMSLLSLSFAFLLTQIHQALEAGDEALCAKLYLTQADACIGIAGEEQQQQQHAASAAVTATATAAQPSTFITTALTSTAVEERNGLVLAPTRIDEALLFLEKARTCFTNIEDIRGECECMAKRALLEKLKAATADSGSGGAGGGAASAAWKDDTAVEEAVGLISQYKSVFDGERGLGETMG